MAVVARLYGVPLADLRRANPGLDPHHLEIGTVLQVPSPMTGWPQMEVLEGEQASALAGRGGFSPEALATLNPGVDLEHLQPGQTLLVPLQPPVPAQAPATVPLQGTGADGLWATPAAQPAATASWETSSPVSEPGRKSVPVSPAGEPKVEPSPPGSWEMVTLADGRRGWAPRSEMLIPSPTPLSPQQVVDLAQKFVGAPYRWGGISPNGVDCSGFVQEVFRLSGHSLPRLADEQFQQTVAIDSPQPGDLVFFTTYLPGPSHVGISLGGNDFLHASSSRGVIRGSLEDGYFKSRYLGAHRPPVWAQATQANANP